MCSQEKMVVKMNSKLSFVAVVKNVLCSFNKFGFFFVCLMENLDFSNYYNKNLNKTILWSEIVILDHLK